ncbi:MAG: hypothetical protein LIP01_15620 [Tannerellaceae bacterium]|nr:hypothetical protein [Tannerellaceae bacterium]
MKTKYILAVLFIVGFMSCDSYFRVVNTVHPDGRFEKEIHTFGDSLFLQGDLQHNPFPFTLDDTWVITCTDSTSYYSYFVRKSTTNVKVNRMYTSAEESSGSMQIENPYTPIFSPSEKVNIYNRWFYTY